jgi:hypothetical protein
LEGFLATVQTVRRSAPDSTRRILDGLRTAGISERRFLPDPNREPFPGLTSFQPKDSPVFFGRDDEVGRLLDRIALLSLVVDRRLILLAGPTGSGKSTLLLAGVIPRLEVESTTWSVCPPIRAGNYKARSLKAQIEGTAATQGTRTLVIPIDQVEEILTSASLTDDNSSLLDELADVFGNARGRLIALGTIRSDAVAEVESMLDVSGVKTELLHVDPMSRLGLIAAVTGPCELSGIVLEDRLAERIAGDCGELVLRSVVKLRGVRC